MEREGGKGGGRSIVNKKRNDTNEREGERGEM